MNPIRGSFLIAFAVCLSLRGSPASAEDRIQIARCFWLLMQNLVQQHPLVAAEGQLTGDQLVKNHAEAVDVAAAVYFV